MSTQDPTPDAPKTISLRIPETLDTKVDAAAKETGLKRSDVLRLSLDRGIDRLLEQLRGEPAHHAA